MANVHHADLFYNMMPGIPASALVSIFRSELLLVSVCTVDVFFLSVCTVDVFFFSTVQ